MVYHFQQTPGKVIPLTSELTTASKTSSTLLYVKSSERSTNVWVFPPFKQFAWISIAKRKVLFKWISTISTNWSATERPVLKSFDRYLLLSWCRCLWSCSNDSRSKTGSRHLRRTQKTNLWENLLEWWEDQKERKMMNTKCLERKGHWNWFLKFQRSKRRLKRSSISVKLIQKMNMTLKASLKELKNLREKKWKNLKTLRIKNG